MGQLTIGLHPDEGAEGAERVDAGTLKPPLKWAGGKRWLLPRLRQVWASYRACPLVEPFCGGLAVALGLMPRRAWLNDINPHAIHFYRWLQKGLTIDIPMENDKDLYYAHRERFNRLVADGQASSKEAAALFYYLNRTCYNGLCRFNRQGRFNVPFGRYRAITYTSDFSAYRRVLSAWTFTNRDFEKLEPEGSDFIYADPPYDVVFRQYAQAGFGWDDQERLATWLARHRGPVVASNQATERIVALYRERGFRIRLYEAPRRISCTGDRAPAREMLAFLNVEEQSVPP